MYRIMEAPADVDDALGAKHFTAGFSCPLEYLEALTAILQHLRHEGQPLKPSIFVESCKDFLLAPYFDPVLCPQRHGDISQR